jgi:MFS family permease
MSTDVETGSVGRMKSRRWAYLVLLFLVATSAAADRHVVSILLEPIREEFKLSDTMVGLMTGLGFTLIYSTAGLPIARWADRGDRRVILTIAVAIWSTMTIVCGFAHSVWHLILARLGVGLGEAGALPPAQSLVADYFHPTERARAMAFFMASAMAGYLLGLVGGAQIASAYGWRIAFIVLGCIGLPLGLIVWSYLREPRQVAGRSAECQQEPLIQVFQAIWKKKSLRLIILALIFYMFVAYGALIFLPSYMVRLLGIPLAEAGTAYGMSSAAASFIGIVLGGLVVDRLARYDRRWLVRAPGAILLAALPCYLLALTANNMEMFLLFAAIGELALNAAMPAVYAALHEVCGSARRATTVAVASLLANLFSAGLGPLATGMVSDGLMGTYGPASLRPALMLAFIVFLPTAACLFAAAQSLLIDSED